MSLLMDALKRAEQAKRHQKESSESSQPQAADRVTLPGQMQVAELSLEPVAKPSGGGLPDLDSHYESVDADLKATAAAEPTPKRKAAPDPAHVASQRSAASVVFSAKDDAEPGSQAKRLMVICGIGALAAVAVGTYFYWQLELIAAGGNRLAARPGAMLSGRPAAPVALPQIPAPPAAVKDQPVAAASVPVPEAPKTSAPGEPVSATKDPGSGPVSASTKPSGASAVSERRNETRRAPAAPKTVASARGGTALPVAQAGGVPQSESTLRFNAQSHESAVARGYEDLLAGRLDAARNAYQQALRADRRNPDALVGLATVAQRQGDLESAERYFVLAVEADPRHAGAHAGLASLRGPDGVGGESRLKSLIAQQGSDSAGAGALHFALGNHYAAERRWSDAQQSYFRAHTSDADHPDYLANLAVSLDHLGQPGLARKYYEQAINAAERRPAAFDKAAVQKRLADLGR